MKRKLFAVATLFTLITLAACGGDSSNADANNSGDAGTTETSKSNDEKGIGKFTNVELTTPLNQDLVAKGKAVYDLKCGACHRLNDQKLVGPGWKGVTSRRKPEWIMNFATNSDEMLNKDASAMAMLEECLVRMPNQNISDEDARSIVEFMRSNDGEK